MKETFEWEETIKLKDDAKVYFAITQPVILDKELGKKRIAAMTYILIHKGLNNKFPLSLNYISKWYGREPNRHPSGINGKFADVITNLKNTGYLDYSEKLKHDGSVEVSFNEDKYQEQLNDESTRFAIIYLDEFKKIVEYANSKDKEISVSDDTLLLVFAYLRMMIYRRKNKLGITEINCDNKNSHEYDIKQRQFRAPEAYNAYYSDVAEELGLTLQTLMISINAIEELNLIYTETLPRMIKKDENNKEKWITNHTLFCNTYKREKEYLLAIGKEYYENELDCKKIKVRQYWQDRRNKKE